MLSLLLSSLVWGAEKDDLAGNWLGTLVVPQGTLRLVFYISKDEHGGYTGTLDVPEQQAKDIPLSAVKVTANGGVQVAVDLIQGSFAGKLKLDRQSIVGKWQQGGGEFALTLLRTAQPIAEIKRPQEPQPPFSYDAEEVTFTNPAAVGVTLAGTLTLPRGQGPFAVALLITGSGPEDRNETIFGHKPFLLIADYLTCHGIAVLRVDDRGVGKSSGSSAQATSEDFADDVLAGVRYLQGRKEIDAKRIGLIGHSEGGIIAPMVANKSPDDIAFIVLLAAPGMPGDQLLLLQSEKINRANGVDEKTIAANLSLSKKLIDIAEMEADPEKAEQEMREALTSSIKKLPKKQRAALGKSDDFINSQIDILQSPWMHFFLKYDPVSTLGKLKCPVLALNGELDMQVPYRENLDGIRSGQALAMKNGEAADFTLKSLPGLNHLFQTSKTGSPMEYALIQETFAPIALQAMEAWINEKINIRGQALIKE